MNEVAPLCDIYKTFGINARLVIFKLAITRENAHLKREQYYQNRYCLLLVSCIPRVEVRALILFYSYACLILLGLIIVHFNIFEGFRKKKEY